MLFLAAAPGAPAANWTVNCPGVRNVPMTADPQQSLPLQLVATLNCGEAVTLLANDEGYTAKIQTVDGTTGYIAAMYLKKIPAAKRPLTIDSVTKNGVARWQEGAPGCDHFVSNGIRGNRSRSTASPCKFRCMILGGSCALMSLLPTKAQSPFELSLPNLS